MKFTAYEDLTIQDNFIFQKVMRNKRICKITLERLFDIDIKDISYPDEEKTINVRLDSKSIRLDVYVNDDKGTIFNIEMQTTKDMKELIKRARYYQGLVDIDNIEKGQSYDNLKETYIIFICPFKMFDGLRHKYTFKNICVEDRELFLYDGANKVFLSTKGSMDDIPKPLKAFLDYIDGGKPEDDFIKEIDVEVTRIKRCEDWRREYMTLEIELNKRWRDGRAEGFADGKAEGRAEGEAVGTVNTLYAFVKEGILTLSEASKRANMTEEEFNKIVKCYN